MKNNILILLAIAVFALASCGDEDNGGKTCEYKGKGGHGLSDGLTDDKGNCGKDGCDGLKIYGHVAGQKIHRFGPTNDTNFTDGKITEFAGKIPGAYAEAIQDADLELGGAVQILGTGNHSYEAKILKLYIGNQEIAKFMKEQATPRTCEYLTDGHGIRDGLTNDTGVCGKTGCIGLKDYRPAKAQVKPDPYDDMAIGYPGDYFPWPIYRVGALTTTNYPDTILKDTVADILAVYKDNTKITPSDKTRLHNSALEQVHVTYKAPDDWYTWKDGNLGIQRGLLEEYIKFLFKDVGGDSIDPVAPVVQLQPAGNIRLALNGALRSSVDELLQNSVAQNKSKQDEDSVRALARAVRPEGGQKKKTEQFPAVAGGADKDPKANRVRRWEYSCT